jgi:hypothetical protein
MKNTLLILSGFLFFAAITGFAQIKYPSSVLQQENGRYTYEKVIEVPGKNKEQLYKLLKEWVVTNVKTADNNIIFDDSGFEKIITTPTLILSDIRAVKNQMTSFKLTLNFKENKFRILANGFVYYGEALPHNIVNTALEDIRIKAVIPNPTQKAVDAFDKSFTDFVASIEAASKGAKDKDW